MNRFLIATPVALALSLSILFIGFKVGEHRGYQTGYHAAVVFAADEVAGKSAVAERRSVSERCVGVWLDDGSASNSRAQREQRAYDCGTALSEFYQYEQWPESDFGVRASSDEAR